MPKTESSIKSLKQEVQAGKIFIYPTDTIYGIGCNALDEKAVNKIREIKTRDKDKPISIIAPNIIWILENFQTTKEEVLKFLPGPYTLLLKKKNSNFLAWISSNDRVGIRIPNNSFTEKIQQAGLPFVTTSINLAGEPAAIKIQDIKKEILDKVDYLIELEENEELSGKPSTLIIDGKPLERK